MNWTRQWRASAAPKFRCPILNISKMLRFLKHLRLPPQHAGWSEAMSRFHMPALGETESGTVVRKREIQTHETDYRLHTH